MKVKFTLLICAFLFGQLGYSQVYLDQFDNDDPAYTGGSGTYSFAEADGELTVTASNTGMWDVFTYELHDASSGMSVDVDATGNNKVFVRAKASSVGTQLRMDIQDADGYVTSLAGITRTLTTEYMVLEYDFTDLYQDGGFGGTACASGPCPVDGAQTSQLVFFTDPGVGGFNGSVVIDYIAFGEAPDDVIMSDIFQDHFDQDSSINAFTFIGPGYDVSIDAENSELTITGDGTNPMWDPLTYIFRNPSTLDTIDIDATAGGNKMYVKVKSTVPNTALRLDLQDIDGFVTTQGSITKIVGTEYQVFEYDFSGAYFDLGFGGTPCTEATAPCPVDGSRVADILMFIEPGVGEFLGELTFDYISFGTPLEPAGPPAELSYEDHFNNETLEFIGDPGGGLVSIEVGSEWIITGDGTAGQYAAVSYILHDKDLGEEIVVDMAPGQNKVYLRVRTSGANVPIRLDLIDSTGYTSSQTALTKVAGPDYAIYEYDFSGNYIDGGFGGTPCEAGPCPLDASVIKQVLIYPDPVAGAFSGEVYIDFLSIGQPLGEDAGPTGILNYSDQMDDNTSLFIQDMSGFASTVADDVWTITGDGTGGAFSPVVYMMHNDIGENVIADAVGSNDVLYVRAKASSEVVLRIDVQDNATYVSNLSPPSNTIGAEYAVYEFSYANAYLDGGYGGSPCTSETAPCDVDGQRLMQLQLFMDPGVGGFNGTLDIDWISFGSPIVGVEDVDRLSSLRAFPNPTNDWLRVEYDLVRSANIQLLVYNQLGQLVLRQDEGQQSLGQQLAALNLEGLANGLYVVQVAADGANAGYFRVTKY